MGQLQKRFEDQKLSQFLESPEGKVSWIPGQDPTLVPQDESQKLQQPSDQQKLKIRGLQLGAIIIVVLALLLFLG